MIENNFDMNIFPLRICIEFKRKIFILILDVYFEFKFLYGNLKLKSY